MRVTKIIREYVEKRVKEIYSKESAEELAYEQAKAEYEEELKKANAKIQELIKQVASEINNPHNLRLDISTSTIFTNWGYGGVIPEIEEKARKAKDERCAKKSKAIEDILVNLELGGTKAELEEMLSKLEK